MIEATRAQKKRWFEQRSRETIRPRVQRAVGTALRRQRAAPSAQDAATPRRKNEIWAYVGKKQRHMTPLDDPHQFGDQYTFVALDPETKIVPAYRVGKRDLR